MEPLKTTRRVLMRIGLCSADENTSQTLRLTYIGLNLVINVVAAGYLLASLLFLSKNVMIDLEKSLFSVLQVAMAVITLHISIAFASTRSRVETIFNDLADIYATSKIFFSTLAHLF